MKTKFRQEMEIPDGQAGLQAIVNFLNLVAVHYGQSGIVRQAALEIVDGLKDDAQFEQAERLCQFVKDKVKYVCDPLYVEDVTSPVQLLSAIETNGNAQGDCDDHCVLLASLLQSIGFKSLVVAVKLDSAEWNHVVVLCEIRGEFYSLDPCAKELAPPDYREHLFPA